MFEVEFASEVGINWDGGFTYEYTGSGNVIITTTWDAAGQPAKVSLEVLRQMKDYAKVCLTTWQEVVSEAIVTGKY